MNIQSHQDIHPRSTIVFTFRGVQHHDCRAITQMTKTAPKPYIFILVTYLHHTCNYIGYVINKD